MGGFGIGWVGQAGRPFNPFCLLRGRPRGPGDGGDHRLPEGAFLQGGGGCSAAGGCPLTAPADRGASLCTNLQLLCFCYTPPRTGLNLAGRKQISNEPGPEESLLNSLRTQWDQSYDMILVWPSPRSQSLCRNLQLGLELNACYLFELRC